jgi:hypothetical protein
MHRTVAVETLPRRRVYFSISGRREKDRLAAISPRSDRVFLSDGARNFHSALMLAARTTLAHASVFSTTNFARSAGELTNGSPPKSTIR